RVGQRVLTGAGVVGRLATPECGIPECARFLGCEPALELPADPLRERTGRERADVSPRALEPFAVLGLGRHEHPGATETPTGEPLDEPVGETLGDEGGVVDTRRGRVEL